MKRSISLLVLAALLSGCVPQWVRVESATSLHSGNGYRIDLPDNWVKLATAEELIVSRDGPDLQKITVRLVELDAAFPTLERPATTDMLPDELADRFIANLRKAQQDNLPSWETLAIVPMRLDGNPGFRVDGAYTTDDGVRYRLIAIGATTDSAFASIVYEAARLHFFDRSLPDFERSLASFAIE